MTRLTLVALAALAIVPRFGASQASGSVVAATLRSLRDSLPGRPLLSVESRVFALGPAMRGKTAEAHTPTLLDEAGIPGVAEVISPERVTACQRANAPGCQHEGIAAFVRLSVPTVRNDSAVIDIFLRNWRAPGTATDSARAAAVTVVAGRGGSGVATHYNYTLVRTNGEWRVVKRVIRGQS